MRSDVREQFDAWIKFQFLANNSMFDLKISMFEYNIVF